MKVLIWFGCIFVATILNTLLGYATGIKVGYVLFYFGIYFVARKLCEKWDEHQEAKKRQAEFAPKQPAAAGWRCVCGKDHPAYETSCVCGQSKFDAAKQPKPNVAATNLPTAPKICFCRKCGEKLIEESKFCRACGNRIAEIVVPAEETTTD